MSNTKQVTIKATMTEDQAEAIAQFFKRTGHDDYHLKANHYHANELENMKCAGELIRDALAAAGFDPR